MYARADESNNCLTNQWLTDTHMDSWCDSANLSYSTALNKIMQIMYAGHKVIGMVIK